MLNNPETIEFLVKTHGEQALRELIQIRSEEYSRLRQLTMNASFVHNMTEAALILKLTGFTVGQPIEFLPWAGGHLKGEILNEHDGGGRVVMGLYNKDGKLGQTKRTLFLNDFDRVRPLTKPDETPTA